MWLRALMVAVVFLAAGCGVQQIAPANRRVMQGLQTAVSSRKVEWLDATVKLIDEQRSQGKLSDAEYAALEPIISKARAGNWDAAQRDVFALVEGQKATAEDLQKIQPRAAGKE